MEQRQSKDPCERVEQEPSTHDVAIIMRSKDEQPYADQALAALQKQRFSTYTLYNVDSGSIDGTLEAVKKFNRRQENVIEIAAEDYVPGPVLNMMLERTSEPIVVFLNADAIPLDAYWLENLLAPIMTGEADATMSRQVTRDCARFIDKYDFERAYSPKTLAKTPEFFSAVACAFKRELWEQTKFYTEGYSEDVAWSKACQDKGARFRLVMDSVVEHSHNFTFPGLFRKRYRHGIAFVKIYAIKPNAIRQLFRCSKEIARDLLYALKKLRVDTVPYNITYRIVIHVAYYLGEREGRRRSKREQEEDLT